MSKKILIIEDDPLIVNHIIMILEKKGYICQSFSSGEEAIQVFSKFDPNIVLMDIGLKKGLDGISTANHIRSFSDVPIIFVTGETEDAVYQLARQSKPAHYIEKPFTDAQLLRTVELTLANDAGKFLTGDKNNVVERVEDGIFIYYGKEYIKINFTDIYYLESNGTGCILYCAGQRAYKISFPSNHVIGQINWAGMVQIHRSFFVNIHKIDKLGTGIVTLGPHKLPLTATHQEHFLSRFNKLKHP